MGSVDFAIAGELKDALILRYAFEADHVCDKLLGCNLDGANKLLLTYGATIMSWEKNDSKESVQIKALTDAEFADAQLKIEEYNSWLIETSGPHDFPRPSPKEIEASREEHPCPVKLDIISSNLYHLDPSTFRTNLFRVLSTDGYQRQLWDWKHTARYAYLFAEEEMPKCNWHAPAKEEPNGP